MPRNRYGRRPPLRERRKVFVIATEGKETEPRYFNTFKGEPFRKNVQTRPPKDGQSSLNAIMRRLDTYAKEIGVYEDDELWLVADVDHWSEAMLDNLCRRCAAKGYHVAVSNPCFEFWLVLHQPHPPTPSTARACVAALDRQLGAYDKARYNPATLLQHVEHAIVHARRLDANTDESWPHAPGTHVYKLVERLIADPPPDE
jgi:hypothetical protein